MQQWCRVCGEAAAGFHFGAFTCEGCKSFFGRSCNSSVSALAECKSGGRCVITRKNRTACKSCRLRQCIRAGMSKSGSRYGRRSNWFKIHCLLQDQPQPSSSPAPAATATLSSPPPNSGASSLLHANEPFTILSSNSDSSLTITKKEIKHDPDQRDPMLRNLSPLPPLRVSVREAEHDSGSPMEETVTITRKCSSRLKQDISCLFKEQQSLLFQHQVQQVGERIEQESQFSSGAYPNFFLPSQLQNSALQLQLLAQAAAYPNVNPVVPLQFQKISQSLLNVPQCSSEDQDTSLINPPKPSKQIEDHPRLPSATSSTKTFLEYFNEMPNIEAKCELLKTVEYYRQHFSKLQFSQMGVPKISDETTYLPFQASGTLRENLDARQFAAAAAALPAIAQSTAMPPIAAAAAASPPPLGLDKVIREEQLEPIDLSLRRISEEIIDVTNVSSPSHRGSCLDDSGKHTGSQAGTVNQKVWSREDHKNCNVTSKRKNANENEGSVCNTFPVAGTFSASYSSKILSDKQSVFKSDLNHNEVDRIHIQPSSTDASQPRPNAFVIGSNFSARTSSRLSSVESLKRSSPETVSQNGASYSERTKCSPQEEIKSEAYFRPSTTISCLPENELDSSSTARINAMHGSSDTLEQRLQNAKWHLQMFGSGNSKVLPQQTNMISELLTGSSPAESSKESVLVSSDSLNATCGGSTREQHPVMECSVTVEQVYPNSSTTSLSSGVYDLKQESSHKENLVA